MYLVRTPEFIQKLFPDFVWRINGSEEKNIYLTFDDGPIPEVTPWVMEQLAGYNAKATFFCVGENAARHPQLLHDLRAAGHSIGNHTYNHLNGWTTDNAEYFRNVRKSAKVTRSDLFRPPYGRIKPSQAKFLGRHYRIVMWDVLSGDFDQHISKEQCFDNVLRKARPGSVVVFHDSLKADAKLRFTLPRVLEEFAAQGYRFLPLTEGAVMDRKGRIA